MALHAKRLSLYTQRAGSARARYSQQTRARGDIALIWLVRIQILPGNELLESVHAWTFANGEHVFVSVVFRGSPMPFASSSRSSATARFLCCSWFQIGGAQTPRRLGL